MNPGGNQIGVGGRLAEKRIELDQTIVRIRDPRGPGGAMCTPEEFGVLLGTLYGDEGALQVMSDGAVVLDFVRAAAASNQGLRGERNRERISALHHRYNGKETRR